MKFKEIIDRLDKSSSHYIDDESLFNEFQLEFDWNTNLEDHGFEGFDIGTWTCTDTTVGFVAIFFEGEFVAMTFQKYRKASKSYNWASEEARQKVFAKLLSLRQIPETTGKILDMDEEFGFGYPVEYGSNLPNVETVFLKETGEPVKVINIYEKHIDIDKWKTIVVKRNGKKETMALSDIRVPWNIV